MSLWTDQQPPVLYPNAVATEAGWADPVTGELYVAVTGLSTFKGAASELVKLGIYNNKSQFTTSQELGHDITYAAGDYIVLEAVFSEAVTWSGGPPSISGTINTTPVTFAYFQDTTDQLSASAGKVTSITIGGGGQQYQVGDKLIFGGSGQQGNQTFPNDANLSGVYDDVPGLASGYVSAVGASNAITGIVLTSGGSSYASAPTVTVDTGHVVSVTVGGSGTGYLNGDRLVFGGGGGTGAAGYIVVNAAGNVTKAVLTNRGTGYTSAPTAATATSHGSGNTFTPVASYGAATPASLTAVLGIPANGKGTNRILFRYQVASNLVATSSQITFTSPIGGGATWTSVDSGTGTSAAASGVVSSGVTSYTMTNNGSGYVAAPLVSITSTTGTGATALAVLDNAVNTVTPVLAGVGYRSVPSVTQSGGGSTNATITPVLGTAGIVCDVTIGGTADTTVTPGSVTVDNTGHGGTGFAASVTGAGGDITGITITNVGSGYTSAPGLTIAGLTNRTLTAVLGFPIASYTVAGTNTGYTAAPGLVIGNPATTAVSTTLGAGVVVRTTATATATIYTLQTVKSVQVESEGSGYSDATVVFTPVNGGTLAAATAVFSGALGTFVVTNPGSGYTVAPTVTVGAGDGTGALATATIDDRGHVIAVTTNGYVSAINVSGTSNNNYIEGEKLSLTGNAKAHIHVVNTVTTNSANGFETITAQTVTAVIDDPGTGYNSVPVVKYPRPSRGAGLTFTAVVAGTSAGSGYTATLPIAPATPIYSAAVVSFTPATETPVLTFDTSQFVSGVTVGSTGTGYETGQALVFTGAAVGGNVAVGTIRANNAGNIIGVVLTNAGSYTTPPTIVVAPPPTWSGSASNYALGQVVLYSGTRYKVKIGGVTNFNEQPDTATTFWTALTDNTLTAVMGSAIAGSCTVDGVAPTVSSADITHDRFGDVITQTTFNTGDFFTLTLNTSKPVFVVNGSGATVPLVMTSSGSVSEVTIGGSATTGVVAGPVTVTNAGHGGTGFAAIVTVDGSGDITGVVVTNVGSGYTSAPTMTIASIGSRTLTAVLGGTARYFSGSGTNKLHFAYQVASTDVSAPTTFSVTSPIVLAAGTTIKDAAGNPLTLTFSAPTTTGITIN